MRRAALLFAGAMALTGVLIGGASLFPDLVPDTFSGQAEVLRCYTGEGCNTTTITERPMDCNEWYVGMGQDALRCRWVSDDIHEVTLVSDIGNYITAPISDTEIDTERHSYGLQTPWDLEFLPDGSMLVTEDTRTPDGWITHIEDGERDRLQEIETVNENAVGLMGLAIHPDYPDEPFIYVYYTNEWTPGPEGEGPDEEHYFLNATLERYRFTEDGLTDRTVLLEDITQNKHMAGGSLEFGPDGMLYLTTGRDTIAGPISLQPDRLPGKVLRLRPDGSVPEDNPFNNSVYALGFKNPQGLAWHPETGELYAAMHGKNRYDEINRVTEGGNYGWPMFRCDERGGETYQLSYTVNNTAPVWCTEQWTLAPSQASFVTDPDHPWYGDLFVASLRGKHVHRFIIEDGIVQRNEVFYRTPQFERMRDVEFWNGTLYALTDMSSSEGTIIELGPAADAR